MSSAKPKVGQSVVFRWIAVGGGPSGRHMYALGRGVVAKPAASVRSPSQPSVYLRLPKGLQDHAWIPLADIVSARPNPGKAKVSVEDHGSLVLVRPITKDAREWLEEHTDGNWFGGALVVEPRYVEDLLAGMAGDIGLTSGRSRKNPSGSGMSRAQISDFLFAVHKLVLKVTRAETGESGVTAALQAGLRSTNWYLKRAIQYDDDAGAAFRRDAMSLAVNLGQRALGQITLGDLASGADVVKVFSLLGRRGNPSRSCGHRGHYQGKCSTDWNWGLGEKSREARRTFPSKGVYAVVTPAGVAGLWDWRVHPQTAGHGPIVGGAARSSNAAKAEATAWVAKNR